MTELTQEAFEAVVASLGDDDMTQDGKPKMDPLNAALIVAGFDEIDAATRDAMLDAMEAPEDGEDSDEEAAADPVPDAEPAPEGMVRLILRDTTVEPALPVFVHGLGNFKLPVGKEVTVPVEVQELLDNAGKEYDLVGEDDE